MLGAGPGGRWELKAGLWKYFLVFIVIHFYLAAVTVSNSFPIQEVGGCEECSAPEFRALRSWFGEETAVTAL